MALSEWDVLLVGKLFYSIARYVRLQVQRRLLVDGVPGTTPRPLHRCQYRET